MNQRRALAGAAGTATLLAGAAGAATLLAALAARRLLRTPVREAVGAPAPLHLGRFVPDPGADTPPAGQRPARRFRR